MLDMLIVVTAADVLGHLRNALRLAGEATATVFVWAYLVLVVAQLRWDIVTPPEVCGTGSGAFLVALLMLGVVVAVIVQRDSRLVRSGELWPPLTWLRAAPATLAILMLLAALLFAFAFK
jgi:hypothetical protein